MKAKDTFHKWTCTWAGMYDATYRCHACGLEFITDFHNIDLKPKKGCTNKEKPA